MYPIVDFIIVKTPEQLELSKLKQHLPASVKLTPAQHLG